MNKGSSSGAGRPLVSVIIPTYNRAHVLPRALDSVLEQTYEDWELLIVDDGSTDDTALLLRRYRDRRVRHFFQPNQGPSAARNLGIRLARGQYIAFLDSDDKWLPRKLEAQMRCFDRDERVGLVACGAYLLRSEGGGSHLRVAGGSASRVSRLDLAKGAIWPSGTSGAVVRARCFAAVGAFDVDLRFGEDWDMWLRIASHYEITCLREPLAVVSKRAEVPSEATVPVIREAGRRILVKNRLQECPAALARIDYLCAMSLAGRERLRALRYLASSAWRSPRSLPSRLRLQLLLKIILPPRTYSVAKRVRRPARPAVGSLGSLGPGGA